jgi:hypothetical protein
VVAGLTARGRAVAGQQVQMVALVLGEPDGRASDASSWVEGCGLRACSRRM